MSAVPTTAAQNAARSLTLSRTLARRLALPLLFVVAASYHAWQSTGHATPTVFNDELLYGKLSQAIAAGHGLSIRGEHVLLPRPARAARPVARLAARLDDRRLHRRQDPERHRDVGGGLSRVLARAPLVRPSFALLTAAAAVATPALVYHALPHVRGARVPGLPRHRRRPRRKRVAKPSRQMAIAVPARSASLAVATRVQFLVLPLAYLAAVAICGRGRLSPPSRCRSALAAALVALARRRPGRARTIRRGAHLGSAPGAPSRTGPSSTATLLPYSVGLAIVMGAVFGLGFMLIRPERKFEQAFAALAISCTSLFMGQAALICRRRGEAARSSATSSTSRRCSSSPSSPTRSAEHRAHVRISPRRASVRSRSRRCRSRDSPAPARTSSIRSRCPRSRALRRGWACRRRRCSTRSRRWRSRRSRSPCRCRRRGVPELFALLAIADLRLDEPRCLRNRPARDDLVGAHVRLIAAGLARPRRTSAPRATSRSPARTRSTGRYLESWNRDLRGVVVLDTQPPDPFPAAVARVARRHARDRREHRPGADARRERRPARRSGSKATIVARPRDGLVAYRIPAGAHVRWLACGPRARRLDRHDLRYPRLARCGARRPLRAERSSVPDGTLPRKVELTLAGKRSARSSFVAGQRDASDRPHERVTDRSLGLYVDVPEITARRTGARGEGSGSALRDGQRTFDALHRRR